MTNIEINRNILIVFSVFILTILLATIIIFNYNIYTFLYISLTIVMAIIIYFKPIIGVYILVLISPFSVLTIIPRLGMSLFSMLGFYTITVWLLNHILIMKEKIYTDKIFWSMIIFLSWAIMSLFWTSNTNSSINGISMIIQLLGFYLIIINSSKDEKTMLKLITLFILGVFISSLISIKQLLTVGIYSYRYRLALTGQNPNTMGFYSGIAIIYILYFLDKLKKQLKPLAILVLIVLLVSLIFSESRGAWIAIGVVTLIFIYNIRTEIRKYILSVLIIFIILFSSYTLIKKVSPIKLIALQKRVTSIYHLKENHSAQSRISFWKTGLEIWKDHPIIGVGIWNYPDFFQKYTCSPNKKVPHNVFVAVLVELGIIGLLLLFLVLFNVFKKAQSEKYRNLNLLILLFLIIISIKGGYIWDPIFWFLFAEISNLGKLSSRKNQQKKEEIT